TSSLAILAGKSFPTPNSDRLMVPVTLKPAVVFLLMGLTIEPLYTASSVTDLVTPCSVRSPVNSYLLSPTFLNEVLLNVWVPYCAASKKASLFRWPFRCSLPVLMLLISAVNSITTSEKSSFEDVSFAEAVPKLPVIWLMPIWPMTNITWECALSMFHSWALAPAAANRKTAVLRIICFIFWFFVCYGLLLEFNDQFFFRAADFFQVDETVVGTISVAERQEGNAAQTSFRKAQQLVEPGVVKSFHWGSVDLFAGSGRNGDTEGDIGLVGGPGSPFFGRPGGKTFLERVDIGGLSVFRQMPLVGDMRLDLIDVFPGHVVPGCEDQQMRGFGDLRLVERYRSYLFQQTLVRDLKNGERL